MAEWKDIPGTTPGYGYRQFVGRELEKSSLDDRDYRLLELHNGLKAVLVHDAAADKAAACLTVSIGHMEDPFDMQGLAHFCEHMISKGSESFPGENDFYSFIASNGGTRNAATGTTYTEYWFSISPSKLSGALPRLAGFFSSPLFTESLSAREINAVDSEFKRNLQLDGRRCYHLTKRLCVPDHPFSKFSTGSVESLTEAARSNGRDEEAVMKETRRRLVEWWRKSYCAGRMTLAVVGKESLDELTALTVPLFSPIVNNGLSPRPTYGDSPVWSAKEMGTIVYVRTIKDYRAFTIAFQIPDQYTHFKTKPVDFLSHFLGHEGTGSVCAYLKKRGWLLSLSAGRSGGTRSAQFLQISGRLTVEGYLHYKEVVLAVFNYISMLRSSPLEKYHFDEVRTLAETSFRFKQKTQPHSYATFLSSALIEPYPPEWLLSGSSQYREWDEKAVRDILDTLTPDRARVTLEAQNHPEEVTGNDVQWETERWYGVQYYVRRLDHSLLEEAGRPNENSSLFLPTPNPFIPEDLSVGRIDVPTPARSPVCVADSSEVRLWHKKDDQFWVPKAHVQILIRSPLAYATPKHATMTRLLSDLVEDALSELTYDADLAGLSYSVSNGLEGLFVSARGYNDKLDVLLRMVAEKLRGLDISPDRLGVFMEKLKLDYENYYLGQPCELARTYALQLLMPVVWPAAAKLPTLLDIDEHSIRRHKEALLDRTSIEVLVNGNLTAERSREYLASIQESLRTSSLPSSQRPRERAFILPPGSNIISRKTHANPKEVNSSLSYFCQFGDVSDTKLRCILALIAHMIREPCYSQLRTQQQLGYVVASSQWMLATTMGLDIRIQSTRSPWFVEERVEAFLESFGDEIAGMSADAFDTHKAGLVTKKRERAKNLQEETALFWAHIKSGRYEFLQNETDASLIGELTLEDVVRVYDSLVRPSSTAGSRKKLSVQLISQQLHEDPPAVAEGTVLLLTDEDESAFKAGLVISAAATPVAQDIGGRRGLSKL